MHLELSLQNVLVLLTIQLTVFGWRINREMKLAEQKRRIWLPINDILNVIGGFAVLAVCIILPLSCTEQCKPCLPISKSIECSVRSRNRTAGFLSSRYDCSLWIAEQGRA